MGTALRFVARKICSRALERPAQPLFSAATSVVVKEEQRMLLPRISHGGSSLRRFSSSESPNLDNKKHLPCEAKSGLAKLIDEKKLELLHLLRQMEGEYSMVNEPKELQHLLQRSNNRVLTTSCNVTAGATLAAALTVFAGYKFVLGRKENN